MAKNIVIVLPDHVDLAVTYERVKAITLPEGAWTFWATEEDAETIMSVTRDEG